MSKFDPTVDQRSTNAAAAAIKKAGLAEKVAQAAHPVESYKDGDIITIFAGLGRVSEFTNSEKTTIKYICFDGKCTNNGAERPITISLNSLTTPSWGDSEEIVDRGKRDFNMLKLRFGNVKISFASVNKTEVPYIEEETVLPALQVKSVFVPQWDKDTESYAAKSRDWAVVN